MSDAACRAAETAPRVPVTAAWSERSRIWSLTVVCPHFGRRHHHGGGDGPAPDYGRRPSHGLDRTNPGYALVAEKTADAA